MSESFITRELVAGKWKTVAFTFTPGAGSGITLQAMGYSNVQHFSPATAEATEAKLFWDEPSHWYVFPISSLAYTVRIWDTETQYVLKPHLYVVGGGEWPEIPDALRTLLEGWGADVDAGYDVGFAAASVICIDGEDAGKGDFRVTSGDQLPLARFLNPAFPEGSDLLPENAVIPLPNVAVGDLGTSQDEAGHILVQNVGTYSVSHQPYIDFYYPPPPEMMAAAPPGEGESPAVPVGPPSARLRPGAWREEATG